MKPEYKLYDGYAKKRARLLSCFYCLLGLFLLYLIADNIPVSSFCKTALIFFVSLFLLAYFIYIYRYIRFIKCPLCHTVCKPYHIDYKIERRVFCEKCQVIWGLDYGGMQDTQNRHGSAFDASDGDGDDGGD